MSYYIRRQRELRQENIRRRKEKVRQDNMEMRQKIRKKKEMERAKKKEIKPSGNGMVRKQNKKKN